MRRLYLAVTALALAGCDLVFSPGQGPGAGGDGPIHDLDGTTPRGDGPFADAASGDASALCPPGGTPVTTTYSAREETMIVMSSPSTPYGARATVSISADIRSRGLYEFAVDDLPVAPIEIELDLPYARQQDECSLGCGACDLYERSGIVTASMMTSAWNQAEATWFLESVGHTWAAPGADDPADHSAIGISVEHLAATDTSFVWNADQSAEAWSWRQSPSLSVLVVPDGAAATGTMMITTTSEGVTNQCVPDDAAATLRLTVCLP